MSKKANHLPFGGNLYSRIDGYKLPALLDEFRISHSDLFHNTCGFNMELARSKIHESLDGFYLAIHPFCWEWLTKRVGVRAGLVIAHWLIDTRQYALSAKFLDWAQSGSTYGRQLAATQLSDWLKGEQERSNKNRETHKKALPDRQPDEISNFLWSRAKFLYPKWASNEVKRLPSGAAKELSRAIKTKNVSPEAVRKRLDRMRNMHLAEENSDAP